MRRQAARLIASDPNHPLRFLLDQKGRFKRTRGVTHAELAEDPDLVQMGHITSRKSGEPECVMLQGAWENQFNNVTVETPSMGGYVENEAVDIGGVAVDVRTAQFWESNGPLPEGTVANAARLVFREGDRFRRRRAADERAADRRAADERAARCRAADERGTSRRAADERAARRRAADERGTSRRAADERGTSRRAADERGARHRSARQRAPDTGPLASVAPDAGPLASVAPDTGPLANVAPDTGPLASVAPDTGPRIRVADTEAGPRIRVPPRPARAPESGTTTRSCAARCRPSRRPSRPPGSRSSRK